MRLEQRPQLVLLIPRKKFRFNLGDNGDKISLHISRSMPTMCFLVSIKLAVNPGAIVSRRHAAPLSGVQKNTRSRHAPARSLVKVALTWLKKVKKVGVGQNGQ